MLKIAVPNKGSLSETAAQMLAEAGYHGRRDPRELVTQDPKNNVEFFYLRPRDIATYVGSGALDVGITGRDLLLDSESPATEVAELDFGESTFRFAAPGGEFTDLDQLHGRRVATSYPGLVGAFLARSNITATLVKLDGAVESAVRLGVADAVADVVSTGSTLRKAGLEIFGPVILQSTAVLISSGTPRPGGRHTAAPAAGRARGPPVRADGLRRAPGAARRRHRHHSRYRIAHDLAARRRRLGSRSRHGAARGRRIW